MEKACCRCLFLRSCACGSGLVEGGREGEGIGALERRLGQHLEWPEVESAAAVRLADFARVGSL